MKPDGSDARRITELKDAAATGPAWSPDRQWIAFSAAIDPEFQLTPRNLFVIRADGSGLRQVTPIPRAGLRLDDVPKGTARGRALRVVKEAREPAAGFRVTAYGTRRAWETGPDGTFQIFLPSGGGWVKIEGVVDGRRWSGTRFATVREGATADLGDIVLSSGGDGEPCSPAWSGDGRTLAYLFRHSLVDRAERGGTVSLRVIRADGSGDQTLATPERVSIVAGPLLQGGVAWIKTSDGRIFRIDLDTRRISAMIDAGTGVPDALAIAPDGTTFATLRLEDAGMLSIALVRNGKPETLVTFRPDEAAPHAIDFSPDGSMLVMDRRSGTSSDLWTLTIASKAWTRLTSDGASSDPVWNGR
jgi:Tol biopolymer transport system component